MVTLAMVIMCVGAIAVAHRPSPLEAAVATNTPSEQLEQLSDVATIPPPVTLLAVNTSAAKTAALKAEKTRIAEAPTPAAAVAAIEEALNSTSNSSDTTSTPELAATESISAAPAPAPVTADVAGPGTVTVTGCLEASGKNGFRLTDTEGGDTPRSRSWRTGFLKKHSSSVALVDSSDSHALQAQVGQRVAATGVLTNRELRMTSLRTIGARCN